jgi:uncharacterized membrane protein YedE/YeeE
MYGFLIAFASIIFFIAFRTGFSCAKQDHDIDQGLLNPLSSFLLIFILGKSFFREVVPRDYLLALNMAGGLGSYVSYHASSAMQWEEGNTKPPRWAVF